MHGELASAAVRPQAGGPSGPPLATTPSSWLPIYRRWSDARLRAAQVDALDRPWLRRERDTQGATP